MTEAEQTRRVGWLTRCLGFGGLALMAVTWRLWTPQDVFPRVPLFWWAPPHALDWSALAITLLGFAGLIVAAHRAWGRQLAAVTTAIGFALLFLSDQHRLQPWAWQFFVLAMLAAIAEDRTFFIGWRWLVISIYAWSAVSKFDIEFRDSMAPWLMRPLVGLLPKWGLSPLAWQHLETMAQWSVWALPVGELAIAVLLTASRTRRWGLYGSWLMHLALIAILGPFGLNHSLGVILWNAFFVVQNHWLFNERLSRPATVVTTPPTWRTRFAQVLLGFVLLWPAFEPWGWCDPWLGWAVYVPRFERVEIWLTEADRSRLSPDVQKFLPAPGSLEQSSLFHSRNIRIGQWSLATLGAPTFPHPRFTVAVAIDLCERGHIEDVALRITQRSSRHRAFQWSDSAREIIGREALEAYARTFRLNAFPESYYSRRAGGPGTQ